MQISEEEFKQTQQMEKYKDRVIVRRAEMKDLGGIFNVAQSVGKAKKTSYDGFLMDNYEKNPDKYKKKFEKTFSLYNIFMWLNQREKY